MTASQELGYSFSLLGVSNNHNNNLRRLLQMNTPTKVDVCLSICILRPSAYVCLSVGILLPSAEYESVYLCLCLSICLYAIFQSLCMSICLYTTSRCLCPVYMPVCMVLPIAYVCLSVCLSVYYFLLPMSVCLCTSQRPFNLNVFLTVSLTIKCVWLHGDQVVAFYA